MKKLMMSAAIVVAGASANAQEGSFANLMEDELRAMGFEVTTSRGLLGRTKIDASLNELEVELVLSSGSQELVDFELEFSDVVDNAADLSDETLVKIGDLQTLLGIDFGDLDEFDDEDDDIDDDEDDDDEDDDDEDDEDDEDADD